MGIFELPSPVLEVSEALLSWQLLFGGLKRRPKGKSLTLNTLILRHAHCLLTRGCFVPFWCRHAFAAIALPCAALSEQELLGNICVIYLLRVVAPSSYGRGSTPMVPYWGR